MSQLEKNILTTKYLGIRNNFSIFDFHFFKHYNFFFSNVTRNTFRKICFRNINT